ncbi:MAG: hypothetical protein PSN35_07070 [Candidatus Thioglobus sp.]|uniref:hypothetical protein n=1 Tax=Candidatus Thioglobus sp. TaxID=2026721 RepID=UPI00260A4DC0|nr:hypothetical protein [Candidatus Thioglobus sp.]MDC9727579.1 hypothetical protein [Candidatus Thioglobus sp.]
MNKSWLHEIPRATLSITHGFMALKDSNLINTSWIHGNKGLAILSITHGCIAVLEQSYQ